MIQPCRSVFVIFAAILLCACSDSTPPRRETYPVTGEVYVDGKPAKNLRIQLHFEGEMDKDLPTESTTMTDENGKFAFSTYEQGDGAPVGEYVATFVWDELNLMTMRYEGADKLNNRYDDPKKSKHPVKVVAGVGADMGRVELKTK